MTGGRSPRAKGDKGEREVVHLHARAGIASRRQPFSGGLNEHAFREDVLIAKRFKVQVKRRGPKGFGPLYRWLEGANLLFLRRDGDPTWLVVMSADLYLALAGDELRRLSAEPTLL